MTLPTVRVAFCLPGLHRVSRGAEVVFESVGAELATQGGYEVTLFGSGHPRESAPYRFVHAACRPRESLRRFPSFPAVRHETHWEELSFIPDFLRKFSPSDFDVTVVCSYPFLNWAVRARRLGKKKPAAVFVTQNGDWPMHRKNSEYRLFGCDGVICTNPDYYDAHLGKWPSALIPNGVDVSRFVPGEGKRRNFGVPEGAPLVFMASALIESKRVIEGIRAVAKLPEVHLLVAGDGGLRDEVDRLGLELMGERFHRVSVTPPEMPDLYRSASVFLHMSTTEPFGNVYVEALATGLPIVAHDRRATRWMLGDHALLVDALDLDAVAGAIRRCLDRPGDGASRVAAARERFQWSSVARQYGDFFRSVLAAN